MAFAVAAASAAIRVVIAPALSAAAAAVAAGGLGGPCTSPLLKGPEALSWLCQAVALLGCGPVALGHGCARLWLCSAMLCSNNAYSPTFVALSVSIGG